MFNAVLCLFLLAPAWAIGRPRHELHRLLQSRSKIAFPSPVRSNLVSQRESCLADCCISEHQVISGPWLILPYFFLSLQQYFVQDQDHFDGSNTNTWLQAYYVNDTYWKGASSDAPVFVCVGGEGPPLDGSAVVSSVHCNDAVELLPKTGAIMFALEHRFYGCHNMSACPVSSFDNPVTAASLHYLSSRQALGDLAAFHAFISDRYALTPANHWVSFGGSYPGMLAGWFRTKYPHLVHAAVSSSAPVIAQVDMVGYKLRCIT